MNDSERKCLEMADERLELLREIAALKAEVERLKAPEPSYGRYARIDDLSASIERVNNMGRTGSMSFPQGESLNVTIDPDDTEKGKPRWTE